MVCTHVPPRTRYRHTCSCPRRKAWPSQRLSAHAEGDKGGEGKEAHMVVPTRVVGQRREPRQTHACAGSISKRDRLLGTMRKSPTRLKRLGIMWPG